MTEIETPIWIPIVRRLTAEEQIRGAWPGFIRTANAVLRDFTSRHARNVWSGSVEASMAELTGSLVTGLPWTGEHLLKDPPYDHVPDLGECTEVHWTVTQHRDFREPVLRFDFNKDHRERDFILVYGYAPEHKVYGLMRGQEIVDRGADEEWPERHCKVVPASWLHPLWEGQEIEWPT